MQTTFSDNGGLVKEPDFRNRLKAEGISEAIMEDFRCFVFDFYEKSGRHEMIWRHTTDPYQIIVSEIMLQQTQVPRVEELYPAFIEKFPDSKTLASASAAAAISAWQGLGYNRRVLNLQKLCQIVETEYVGVFPKNPELLVKLPGIGPATSCSIAAFVWNADVVFIETNIRRVFIHYFFDEDEAVDDAQIFPLVCAALPKGRAREWYWALMDLGTDLKTKVPNPNRRSRQYVKQSQFEGSNRQVRGAVLKKMLEISKCDAQALSCLVGVKKEKVEKVLEKMTEEGFFVREENGLYRVRK